MRLERKGGGPVNPSEIVELSRTLQGEHSGRENHYDELEAAYAGRLTDRQRYGFFQTLRNKVLPNRVRKDKRYDSIVVNYCRNVVEAKRALIGGEFSIRVPRPPSADPVDPDVMKTLEKLERVLLGWWQESNVGRRMLEVGYYNALLGTAIGVVWPNVEKERPTFQVRSPRGFYPLPKDADGYELGACIFYAQYYGKQAEKMFKIPFTDDTVKIWQYMDESQIRTVDAYGRDVKPIITHEWGFVPVVCIPNIGIPGSPFGESDLENIIEIQKEINYRITLKNELVEHMLQQPIVIDNPDSFPDDAPMGPNDVITTTGGKAYRLAPVQIPWDYFKDIDTMVGFLRESSDTPASLSSDPSAFSGTVTGRGFTALTSPVQGRVDIRVLNTIFPAVERMNWMGLKMAEKWPGEHTVHGYMKKSSAYANPIPYAETYDIKEFGGWYENTVYRQNGSFYDNESSFIQLLQGVQNELISPETAMLYIPGVDDVPAEIARIDAAREKRVQAAVAAQQVAQSPTTAVASMAEQGRTNYGLQQGYMGKTPPMQAPGGLPLPKPGTPPAVDVVSQLVDLIREVQNVKGSVYLVGGAVMGDVSKGVELAITDPLDKQTILNHVKQAEPIVHGKIKFIVIPDVPQEPYIIIFENGQAGSGYDVQGGQGMAQTPPQGTPQLPTGGPLIPQGPASQGPQGQIPAGPIG
jgi:hypothetical protein